jgi:hypothetical protein
MMKAYTSVMLIAAVIGIMLIGVSAVTMTSTAFALEPGTYHVHTQNGVNGHGHGDNDRDGSGGSIGLVKPVEGWKRGK